MHGVQTELCRVDFHRTAEAIADDPATFQGRRTADPREGPLMRVSSPSLGDTDSMGNSH